MSMSEDGDRQAEKPAKDEQATKLGNDDANKLGRFAQYSAPAMLALLASNGAGMAGPCTSCI
jgi:hypothetical protein